MGIKEGSTVLVKITLPVSDIADVSTVIFTIIGKTTITLTYPTDVTYSDSAFWLPLSQEQTTSIVGRNKIEAQINYADKAVQKSESQYLVISESLATQIVENNAPDSNIVADMTLDTDGNYIVVGGVTDYDKLDNRPQINGVVLTGNKTTADLSLPTKTSDLTNDSGYISDLSNYYNKTQTDTLLAAKQATLTFDTTWH